MTYSELRETVIENKQELRDIKSGLDLQKERFENNKQNYQTLYDGLGNQIAIASFILFVIAAALGYFVTYYIRKKQEEIQISADTARKAVEGTIKATELLKIATESINKTKDYIDNHNQELYIKIKRDYISSYIDRVVKVPEDLENLLPMLFATELLPEDFYKIKGIIDNTNDFSIHRNVLTLLCQHFPLEIIKDISLRDLLFSSIRQMEMSGMFKRDLIKLLESLFLYLKNENISSHENMKLINHVFYNMYKSNSVYFDISKLEDLNCLKSIISISRLDKNILAISVLNDKNIELGYVSWVDKIFAEPKEESLV